MQRPAVRAGQEGMGTVAGRRRVSGDLSAGIDTPAAGEEGAAESAERMERTAVGVRQKGETDVAPGRLGYGSGDLAGIVDPIAETAGVARQCSQVMEHPAVRVGEKSVPGAAGVVEGSDDLPLVIDPVGGVTWA